MKAFILAAVAALSLGVGSAYAASLSSLFQPHHPNVIEWGPDYGNDAGAGG